MRVKLAQQKSDVGEQDQATCNGGSENRNRGVIKTQKLELPSWKKMEPFTKEADQGLTLMKKEKKMKRRSASKSKTQK